MVVVVVVVVVDVRQMVCGGCRRGALRDGGQEVSRCLAWIDFLGSKSDFEDLENLSHMRGI